MTRRHIRKMEDFCHAQVHSGESFGELAILGFVKRRSAVVRAKVPWQRCRGCFWEMGNGRHLAISINQFINFICTSITISQHHSVSILDSLSQYQAQHQQLVAVYVAKIGQV